MFWGRHRDKLPFSPMHSQNDFPLLLVALLTYLE